MPKAKPTGPYLLTVDPGLRGCGVGLFDASTGALVEARYVEGPETGRGPAAWEAMASEVRAVFGYVLTPGTVLVEVMKVYAAGHGKSVNPADLIELAGVGGAIVGALGVDGWEADGVLARDWKGQVPKDIHTARTKAECARRGEGARVHLPAARLAHNVWDAVGLGYWRLG
jgi:hypothetical protein